MNRLLLGAIGIAFIFLMTSLGAATVLLFRHIPQRRMQLLTGFSAGVTVAASLWSLLLPAIEQAAQHNTYPPWFPAAIGIVCGMLFLGTLDLRMIAPVSNTRQCRLLFLAITLHNIPEGMAVGLSFALAEDRTALWGAAMLALGIGIQNFPEGAAVALPLCHEDSRRGRAFGLGVLSGAVEPLFALAAMALCHWMVSAMPWLLSFAAGAMLYVNVTELIPSCAGPNGTCGFATGFLLMMVLDVALG